MKTSVIGYPRIGRDRELKFMVERYFRNEVSKETLQETARELRRVHWEAQASAGVDYIPSGDFSFYDQVLDTAISLGIIPQRFKALNLNALDTTFAMARGYQKQGFDVKALPMKKWFNTNYHYIVPEFEDDTEVSLNTEDFLAAFLEAKELSHITKPTLVGPYTFLSLAHYAGNKKLDDFLEATVDVYIEKLRLLAQAGAEWIAFEEPALVLDLNQSQIERFERIYKRLLAQKAGTKVLLQTYFGDIRDVYEKAGALPFDGLGLDFVEGSQTQQLIEQKGFPKGKICFAGVINGKNIWKNDYKKTLDVLEALPANTVISTSCSLQHVPYSLKSETELDAKILDHFAFAEEKLAELNALKGISALGQPLQSPELQKNQVCFNEARCVENKAVRDAVDALTEESFVRRPAFFEREQIQKHALALPFLPTTTIGSFPQTAEVKKERARFKKGELSSDEYRKRYRERIQDCVKTQEEMGLDVLVHGEFERNDMVEFFGERLAGFLFTKKAWVQSYGTRCVKPPIVWGDIDRPHPMTVDDIVYAQSLTKKPMKGMLTGPVTILNWSFPREDVDLKTSAWQIALAIRDEVLDLEAAGIKIIQIDEAALREKLPLRKQEWQSHYLDWAIPAFRLVHSGVKAKTQIHTHMCYSEFSDIIREIDAMDADVITFEASRSNLELLDVLQRSGFKTAVGPGVYDIHSPRIPSTEEIENVIEAILAKMDGDKVWVNPDCGLKTRNTAETTPSLTNMVSAANKVREKY
ncbi:MAG: 5-methyltetrahydropteroyltriglutamate--homocysteine S-methyltransferase [Eubacteriales bacterium]